LSGKVDFERYGDITPVIRYSFRVPWRSVSAIVGWIGGSVAAFILLPLWLALMLTVFFGAVALTLNKFQFPWR